MEILEERRLISYYKREGDINTLNTKELGLPLCDELALNTLENKLEDNEFFESMVCYFLTQFNLKIIMLIDVKNTSNISEIIYLYNHRYIH